MSRRTLSDGKVRRLCETPCVRTARTSTSRRSSHACRAPSHCSRSDQNRKPKIEIARINPLQTCHHLSPSQNEQARMSKSPIFQLITIRFMRIFRLRPSSRQLFRRTAVSIRVAVLATASSSASSCETPALATHLKAEHGLSGAAFEIYIRKGCLSKH